MAQQGKRTVEVQPRATRRTHTAEYKRQILAEADACRRGKIGELLRREGLYYSKGAKWRGEREAVNLIMHAAALTQGDDIFILQMGEVVRIVELAERLIRLRGLRPNQDIIIVYTGVRPGEKMHEELYTQAEQPESTLHPYIIKLNTWHEDFVEEAFWRKLDRLSGNATLTQTSVIDQLREVIETRIPVSQRLA